MGAVVDGGCRTVLVVDGRWWLMGLLMVCPLGVIGEKYICMVVWDRRRRDLEGRAGRSGSVVSWGPLLCTIGEGRLLRSCACQMSQCSAVQSVSERRAWGGGVRGSVGSSSVVCSLQMCEDVGSSQLGGHSGVEWSYPHRQHTQYGRLAIRLRVGRACGRCSMLIVKLSSGVCVASVGVGFGGGWSCC